MITLEARGGVPIEMLLLGQPCRQQSYAREVADVGALDSEPDRVLHRLAGRLGNGVLDGSLQLLLGEAG